MQDKLNRYMELALALAQKAAGRTFPNPLVGAVIVKNGRIAGKGFHKKAGGPHAEIFALKNAGRKAKGAVLFVTLEPCFHYGRTPPCVDEIIKSGIKKVYVSTRDANPLTAGKSVKKLRANGIDVEIGLKAREAKLLNEAFFKSMEKSLPLVTIKMAQSIDGKTATSKGQSKWITGSISRKYSHDIRRFYDAILVGINTVLKDDPMLEPSDQSHRLVKVILDSSFRIPLGSRLLKGRQPVIIAAVKKNIPKERRLKKMGVEVVYIRAKGKRIDLKDLLARLNSFEIRSILVEGGSEVIGSFLDERLADKAIVFIAPKIIGGRSALGSVGGAGARSLSSCIKFKNISLRRIGEDFLFEGAIKY